MNKAISRYIPLLLLMAYLISFCNRSTQKSQEGSYLNLNDTVAFAGMETCRGCHPGIYDTYIKTGMGQSFHLASKRTSAAEFSGKTVYDSISNFYYKPFWDGDSLCIEEFRLEGKDTIHRRVEKASYIIGSGQHTNSHICSFNGYLYQMPVTFYTQKRKWDMAPGFEGGFNSRFTRPIAMECMTCHNGLPGMVQGSVNKYSKVQMGIDCERCHGAGGEHVRRKRAGERVDTSRCVDYSIVNPRNLDRDLQMSLCQRCHLQGLAVLRAGKDFDDFKPGMRLHEVWDVFLPETQESREKFIMASQAERLRMSKCFELSGMSCITCHNPHVSVKETPVDVFNGKCQNCHTVKNTCNEDIAMRKRQHDNCSGCHMPESESIDIPHVFITDHFIRKNLNKSSSDSAEVDKVKQYLRLKCFTRENPDRAAMARAYLSFYEKFSQRDYLLDSAAAYLFGNAESKMTEETIHYYFLKQDYDKVTALGNSLADHPVSDPWTYYRVGEAHFKLGNYIPAHHYFSVAAGLQPMNIEFQNKMGAALAQLGRHDEAETVFRRIVNEQPKYEPAWSNLGYLMMREGDIKKAEEYFDKAIALNPDYEMALMNQASLYMNTGRAEKAKTLAMRIIKINPQNIRAKMLAN